jgi:dihydroorotate dehydrogenase
MRMTISSRVVAQSYHLLRPLLFRLDAERAHNTVAYLWKVAAHLPGADGLTALLRVQHPALATTVAGISFANPLGIAAGFDKNGQLIYPLAQLGVGFIELGTVTPRPQPGNPPPRLFRLLADQALINRQGFNNKGAQQLANRLCLFAAHEKCREQPSRLPLGVNIGKNRDTPLAQAAADYACGFRLLAPFADYMVVNVSSPNTPGLRDLQRADVLRELLLALAAERAPLLATGVQPPPVFVKLSPDETPAALDAALDAILATGADGIIATNTTLARPAHLRGVAHYETGGLSGAPLAQRASEVIGYLYQATDGWLPIIGVGGIDSAAVAYQHIRAGASLVQLYTALVYHGPALIPSILRGLVQLLAADGFAHVHDAVGRDVR